MKQLGRMRPSLSRGARFRFLRGWADSFARTVFSLLWAWPMLEYLNWLEGKLVKIYPLETDLILGVWFLLGWQLYRWGGKVAPLIVWRWQITRTLRKRGRYGL